ncbi:IS1096 element passenger TnpR family protein [Planctomicrobium sp. SH661]|uniref:IS1096 element passenger TnpR family protein n=1 Tax=Planctomicrobium sp. SH661 TaxID=3448124 RepID=UPI003F5C4DA2
MSRKQPADDKPLSMEQARGKIAKAMNDLLAGNYSGPISFRLKPTKKPGETYPLKLTQHQRDSLIHCTRIKNKIKERLKSAGEGTQIFGVTHTELDHLNDEIGQAAVYAMHPDKKRLVAVQRKVVELFAEDHAGLFGEETPKTRKTAPKKGDLLYQFKITLLEIKPSIWRRIQIPDCTLADLHEYIQAALAAR